MELLYLLLLLIIGYFLYTKNVAAAGKLSIFLVAWPIFFILTPLYILRGFIRFLIKD